ncbi:7TM diverse intracellular signaling domain-containing protein [Alteromonas arenosi]
MNMQILRSDETVQLSNNFFVLRENEVPFTIEQAISLKDNFRWSGRDTPNYGFSDQGIWLLARFSHFTENNDWVINLDFSQLDKVDFYLLIDGELVQEVSQGRLRASQHYRIPVVKSEIPSGAEVELFIRIESVSSSLIAPVTIRSEVNHTRAMLIDSIIWGLFYGGLIILAIYNLVLYFGAKEKSLLAYVAYILTVLIWQFVWGGHIHLVTFNGISPWLIQHTNLMFVIIGISSGVFSMTFLNTPENAPKSHIIVILMLYLQGILGIAALFSIFPPIWLNGAIYTIGILAIASYICAGIEALSNKFQPARYFMIAWGMLAIGALIGILSLIGFLPSNRFTGYCFQVGVFLEAGLFSLALMDKSRSQLEQEVEQATTDLRNNMELIEEQNARLDIARKDAIKASNVKSQFLANMSHEIRTPLNAILGFSRELSHASLPAEKQEQVRIINGAADSLLTIVNDVLDFSKIEAGKLQLNNQPFSPNQVFEEMVSLMAKSAHQKDLEFIFELGPLPEKLIGDVFRIKQILNNLLSNAIKFTSSGHITFAASGHTREHGLFELQLKVEDTGIGISRQDRKKLFSAFSQVDDALNRNYQGTGLGLVICQELVKLMRGQISLQSTPGQGSCFTITLRMNQLSSRYYLSKSDEWINKRVVIFDPIAATRQATARLMHYLGASVVSCESLDFLDQLAQEPEHVDYLFACLPAYKLEHRNDVLSHLLQFNAAKRILMYSGPDPFNHYPSLSQYFNTQLRMPLTPNKIDSLLRAPKHAEDNPLQSRLEKLPRINILAVDDMEMNLKLIETWLSDTPVNLVLSNSGADALAKCHQQEFDIILMDVQMPHMDGLQATKQIRKTELNMGTPIIAVTAHAFKEEQERLMASGMDDYLPKPIDLNQLTDLLYRWCSAVDNSEPQEPSVDWALAVRRANGNETAARELLEAFIEQLPESMQAIEAAWQQSNFDELQSQIHRIHGASCYTGVGLFQGLCHSIESALKNGDLDAVKRQMPALVKESKSVVDAGQQQLA